MSTFDSDGLIQRGVLGMSGLTAWVSDYEKQGAGGLLECPISRVGPGLI